MDHLDAEHMQAAERYVLGDLSVSEVEEFERHFFDCPQCSEELRALTIFQENARAVFIEQDLAPKPVIVSAAESAASRRGWFSPLFSPQWAIALATLAIGIFAGYVLFSPRDPQAISSYPLYAQARGEETIVAPAASAKFYTLYLDKTWDGEYISYTAVLKDSSGGEKFQLPVRTGAPGQAINVLIPARKLSAGRYVLLMMGNGIDRQVELARFPFTLKFE